MKIFRHFRCLIGIWIDAIAENLLFFALFGLFVCFGCFTLNGIDKYSRAMRVYKQYGFDQAILFRALDSGYTYEIERVKEELEKNPKVRKVEYSEVFSSDASDANKRTQFLISEYGDIDVRNVGITLAKGRYPQKGANEVLLSENLTKKYSIGDVITLKTLDYLSYRDAVMSSPEDENVNEYDYMIQYDVSVVGFISDDSFVLDYGGFGRYAGGETYVDYVLASPYSIYSTAQEMANGNETFGYMLAQDLQYDRKQLENLAVQLFIFPEANVSQDELLNDLPIQVRKNSYTFDMVKENYYSEYGSMIKMYSELAVCFLIAMFTFFVACFSLAIRKRQQELVTYYLFGCSWTKAVTMAAMTYLPGTVLGSVFGIRYAPSVLSRISNGHSYIRKDFYIITLLVALVISVIVILPFYVLARRQTPIELKRGNKS